MKKSKVKIKQKATASTKNKLDDQFTKRAIINGLSDIVGNNPSATAATLSQLDTLFNNQRWYLLSNNRSLISESYIEHGLVQTVIDVPVDDGMRGGVDVKTKQLDPDQIEDLLAEMDECGDLTVVGQGLKWTRLYGGGGVLIMSDQEPETELDITDFDEDSNLEFKDVDLWELYGDQQNLDELISTDVQILDKEPTNPFYSYYGKKIHKSRVMIMKGLSAPSFIRPRLRGWGFSVLEALVRSINQYLKSNELCFSVLDEFKVDVYKIKNLASTLMTSEGTAQVQKRIQLANQQKNFQNAITMDGEDDFIQKELSFAGLAETMQGIRMQIASDMRMPLTKIFGISAAGFSSGEDDIENYNAMVESQVRAKAKYHILKIIKIRCQKKFGFIPDDMSISFRPLRMLSAEQEETVKTQKFTRLLQAKQEGLISDLEFKDAINKDNLLSIQLDTSQDSLDDEDQSPEEDVIPKAAPSAPKSQIEAKPPREAKI